MVREIVGPPDEALLVPVAPMAPDPFVPDVSTPIKLISVMDTSASGTLAVTEMLVKGELEKERQISAVPVCPLVLLTRVHVRPPPEMLLTVPLEPTAPGAAATKAKTNSLPALVENPPMLEPPDTT